ncbi:hypothetical protein PR003_g19371 [Phytophthora rubi]|uniref:Uncharacterized protein n=1 Tax=Phytophthora rubi TaxID=129364 RepID=A0A6A4E002_9STRA|nr:hypothetical protein PR002_g18720 [Phytophthora rubi]KAE9017759.1 hypothetical protein PR001_g14315 [Phytophthora rubi]KAE9313949.1 hypothetical protein PR003_g19371 [Phytophthora rubi]
MKALCVLLGTPALGDLQRLDSSRRCVGVTKPCLTIDRCVSFDSAVVSGRGRCRPCPIATASTQIASVQRSAVILRIAISGENSKKRIQIPLRN